MSELKTMGPIGLRCNNGMDRLWAAVKWADGLVQAGNCCPYLAKELRSIAENMCDAGTQAARATGYEIKSGGGK